MFGYDIEVTVGVITGLMIAAIIFVITLPLHIYRIIDHFKEKSRKKRETPPEPPQIILKPEIVIQAPTPETPQPPPKALPEFDPDVIPDITPLPHGSRMGMRANPCFVGREDELKGIAERLSAARATAIGQVGAVTGLGGIGKTQLAVEYVHRYGFLYPGGVFWLDMEDAEGIPNEIAQCGGIDGMNIDGFDQLGLPDQVKKVQAKWREEAPRLLVFDNIEKPEVVEQWIPASGGARVLITSQCQDWPTTMGIDPLSLETLPPDESLKLLLKNRPEALENEEERAAAVRVCETLGHLPLALDMARAYLGRYKADISVSQYEKDLLAQPVLKSPSLAGVGGDKTLSPTKHEQGVAVTFGMSYGKLQEDNETDALAMKLFHMVSHFAPTSISRELLGMTAGLDPKEPDDRKAQADAISRLMSLGLIQEEQDGRLLMHRLLREFAMRHLPLGASVDECTDAFEGAICSFADEENESGLPARLAAELEHLRHAANKADERESENAGSLFNALGYHQRMVADYEGARENCERALEIDTKTYGLNHPNVAMDLNGLGKVLRAQGDPEGARKNFERALEIDEKAFGLDHPTVATDLNNLGLALKVQGDLEGAKKNYERALDIYKKILSPEHPYFATGLNNLAGVHMAQGDLEGAKKNLKRALEIGEKTFGPDHPKVAIRLSNLGSVLQDLGDMEGARKNYERALEIFTKVFGDEHPDTIQVRENLETLRSD